MLTRQIHHIIQRWCSETAKKNLIRDSALALVAEEYSQALAEVEASHAPETSTFLRFLLNQHQIYDAVFSATTFHTRPQTTFRRQLLSFLKKQGTSADWTHYGLGLAVAEDGQLVITLLFLRRKVAITAAQQLAGHSFHLCGRLLAGAHLRVLVSHGDGPLFERTPRPRRGRFCLDFPLAPHARNLIEIMVEGPYGPEVAVLFSQRLDLEHGNLPYEKIYPKETAHPPLAEKRLLSLINQTRRQHGLAPLTLLSALGDVARDHSESMMTHSFFGHRSPLQGSLEERLAQATLRYEYATENLALSTSPTKAHDALMSSPSHRRNILDPKVTHVGIGVTYSYEHRLLYVTECFVRRP